MAVKDTIKDDLKMGITLLAYEAVRLDIAPMAVVDEAMKESGWDEISGPSGEGRELGKYFYNTALKTYARAVCDGYTGECSIQAAEETDVLENLSFAELKVLSGLIDKKSVAFIRIYSEKELAAASSEEELKALNARNDRMIAEAEVALRKR